MFRFFRRRAAAPTHAARDAQQASESYDTYDAFDADEAQIVHAAYGTDMHEVHEAYDAHVFSVPRDPHMPWQSEDELALVPRKLVLLIPKQPYVDWVKRLPGISAEDLPPELADMAGDFSHYTLRQSRREDRLAFLIPSGDGGIEEVEAFIGRYWSHCFAQALAQWQPDGAHWPPNRDFALFRKWFELELGDMVIDLGGYAD